MIYLIFSSSYIANKIKLGILLLQENVSSFEGKLFLLVFHKIPLRI